MSVGRARSEPDRRAIIIKAAMRRIARDGLEGLRIREVAAEAGIHHATLLHHYPTKDALIGAVVDSLVEDFSSISIAPTSGPPAARLRSHHAAIRARIAATPEVFVVFNELSTRAQRDRAVARALRPTIEGWADFLRSIVEDGPNPDGLPHPFSAEAWIELEMAAIKGLCVRLGEEGCLLSNARRRMECLDRFDEAFRLLESLLPTGNAHA